MNLTNNLKENFYKQGVYYIKNTQTGKLYIGSTTQYFKKRIDHHYWCLNNNTHKNKYLQNSWNKYGREIFIFGVLEICNKNNCLIREQYYIDLNKSNLYNINPLASGTPNMSRETIEKRRQTMIDRYKKGELDHVKEIIRKWGKAKKGMKYSNTDHLKVSKNITDKVLISRALNSEKIRINSPEIDVFDINNNYIITFRSARDIQEQSLNSNFILKSFCKISPRRNIKKDLPEHFLSSKNINLCAKGRITSYKNLIFKFNKTQPNNKEIYYLKGANSGNGEIPNPELTNKIKNLLVVQSIEDEPISIEHNSSTSVPTLTGNAEG